MGFIEWEKLRPHELDALYDRNVADGREILGVRMDLKKGMKTTLHQHEHEEIVMIIQGGCRFSLPDREVVIRDGQMLAIPADTPHDCEALENTIAFHVMQHPRAATHDTKGRHWNLSPEQDLWAV